MSNLIQLKVCEDPPGIDQSEGMTQWTLNAPLGWKFQIEQEHNNTWTLSLENSYGATVKEVNTGVALICTFFGGGVGLTLLSFTRDPKLTAAVASFTYAGCSAALSGSWEDGDEYRDPECIQ